MKSGACLTEDDDSGDRGDRGGGWWPCRCCVGGAADLQSCRAELMCRSAQQASRGPQLAVSWWLPGDSSVWSSLTTAAASSVAHLDVCAWGASLETLQHQRAV